MSFWDHTTIECNLPMIMWKLCGENERKAILSLCVVLKALKGIPTNESTKQQLPPIEQNNGAIGYHTQNWKECATTISGENPAFPADNTTCYTKLVKCNWLTSNWSLSNVQLREISLLQAVELPVFASEQKIAYK